MNEIAARGSRRSFGVSPGAQTATTSPFLTTGEIEFPSKWKALAFFVFFSLTPRSRIATTTPGVLEEHAGTPRVRPIYISGGWRGGGWEGVSQFCSRSSKRLKMPSACDLCLQYGNGDACRNARSITTSPEGNFLSSSSSSSLLFSSFLSRYFVPRVMHIL